jgi:hypothetical protein
MDGPELIGRFSGSNPTLFPTMRAFPNFDSNFNKLALSFFRLHLPKRADAK